MAIGVEDLKAARLRAGMTQAQVAERMGTTQSAVARWERGAVVPSLEAANRYLTAVGADLVIGGVAITIDVGRPSHDDGFLAPEEKATLQRNLRMTPAQRAQRLTTTVRSVGRGRKAMAEAKAKARG